MRKWPSIEERFWAKVNKTESCWLWTGPLDKLGYGRFFWKDGNVITKLAHRYAYFLHYGKKPNGFSVCHTCDIRNCVKPEHLWLGTHADNIRDARFKGKFFERHSKNLNKDKVIELKRVMKNKTTSLREIADSFGLSLNTVASIYYGKSWTWVDDLVSY